jgi:hypothetical protein
LHAAQIFHGVRPGDVLIAGRRGRDQLIRTDDACRFHPLTQQRILRHRKAMTLRQRQHKFIGLEIFIVHLLFIIT